MPDPSQKPEEAVILIVEDNEDDVFLMERALKAAKVTSPYRVVSDGEETTRYLKGEGIYADRAKYPYPAVIFLDLKLPYMSGFEVLEWKLKNKELPPTIVIVITSSNEAKDLKRAYSLGASSYLVKPPTSEQLLEIIQAFRMYWLTYNVMP